MFLTFPYVLCVKKEYVLGPPLIFFLIQPHSSSECWHDTAPDFSPSLHTIRFLLVASV